MSGVSNQMDAKNEISEELRLLSAAVNNISRDTPYQVPAGYFDGFPVLLLSHLGELGEELPSFRSTKKDNSLTFSVPEGYFDNFAQNLLDKIKAGVMGESVSGLSDGLSGEVSEELAGLSPLVNGISRKMPYTAPVGYFEELSSIMGPLSEVREKPAYRVPEGYFDGLSGEILGRLNREVGVPEVQEPARIIMMNRSSEKRFAKPSWWKYPAAAVVAGLIFTIGWLRLHTPNNVHPLSGDVAGNLIKVSDQDLQSYLEDHDQSLSLAEPVNNTVTLDITDSDVKSLLGDVPDGDLKSYMEEHGGPNDIATN